MGRADSEGMKNRTVTAVRTTIRRSFVRSAGTTYAFAVKRTVEGTERVCQRDDEGTRNGQLRTPGEAGAIAESSVDWRRVRMRCVSARHGAFLKNVHLKWLYCRRRFFFSLASLRGSGVRSSERMSISRRTNACRSGLIVFRPPAAATLDPNAGDPSTHDSGRAYVFKKMRPRTQTPRGEGKP